MTTPEDLAKATAILTTYFENQSDTDAEGACINAIAAALSDARAEAVVKLQQWEKATTPKPAAEVVEALEALIERSEAQEQYAAMQRAGRPSDKVLSRMAKTENALQQARAALAAHSAREGE